MHFFSPVNKMPLLEVIRGRSTVAEAVATVVALGKRIGKTVIVVNDGPGFYTSRILAPYINEAAFIFTDGAAVEDIDRALVDFGFPVGPMQLLDEVGIDVAAKVAHVMHDAFGGRLASPAGFEKLVESGRLGRKTKKGFYLYGESKTKEVDRAVYELTPQGHKRNSPTTEAEPAFQNSLDGQLLASQYGQRYRLPAGNEIGAATGIEFKPRHRFLAVAEPTRRGGGSALVVRPG